MCEAFGCLPSQAVRELDEEDADLVWTILDMRAYARMKATFDGAKKKADIDPAVAQQVMEIELLARTLEEDR